MQAGMVNVIHRIFAFSFIFLAKSFLSFDTNPRTPDDGGGDSLKISNTERLHDVFNPLKYDADLILFKI
jgi:hypothetical protein